MWSAYSSQDRFNIIMEYCEGGNLLDFLKTQQPHGVSERWLATAVSHAAAEGGSPAFGVWRGV
jgi:serine/threonine protein kinase